MRSRPCEASRLLAWLGEVLQQADAVNVDVVVMDEASSRSSVQITLHDVPGPLAGFQIRLRPEE